MCLSKEQALGDKRPENALEQKEAYICSCKVRMMNKEFWRRAKTAKIEYEPVPKGGSSTQKWDTYSENQKSEVFITG